VQLVNFNVTCVWSGYTVSFPGNKKSEKSDQKSEIFKFLRRVFLKPKWDKNDFFEGKQVVGLSSKDPRAQISTWTLFVHGAVSGI
jgi:hypothetical protein